MSPIICLWHLAFCSKYIFFKFLDQIQAVFNLKLENFKIVPSIVQQKISMPRIAINVKYKKLLKNQLKSSIKNSLKKIIWAFVGSLASIVAQHLHLSLLHLVYSLFVYPCSEVYLSPLYLLVTSLLIHSIQRKQRYILLLRGN